MRKLLVVVALAFTGCFVSQPCPTGYTNCGSYCADLRSDPRDCGQCTAACAVGDYCAQGLCVTNSCIVDGAACGRDSDCCSGFCASDGVCGCIPRGTYGCTQNIDCCSNYCGQDGYCR